MVVSNYQLKSSANVSTLSMFELTRKNYDKIIFIMAGG